MAGLARVDSEESEGRIAPIDATVRFDMVEEVRRRWVSIAAYYIAQRRDFEQRAGLDDNFAAERAFTPTSEA